jgi:hypothetical protein
MTSSRKEFLAYTSTTLIVIRIQIDCVAVLEPANSPSALNCDPIDLLIARWVTPEKAVFPVSTQCGDRIAPPYITVYCKRMSRAPRRII